MSTRLRPLLLAEAANPEWVSVPLVGWSLARALSARTDAHLVTQVRNREALLRAGLREGPDFTAIDTEALAKVLWKAGTLLVGEQKGFTVHTALGSLSYYLFEHLVWRTFGARIVRREFDVVHRITPLSPSTPSILAGRCKRAGVPFVVGPLNGGVPWPREFAAFRRREQEWLSYVRGVYKLLPGYRATLRDAAAVLVGSRTTFAELPASAVRLYLPENAIDPERFVARRTRQASLPVRAVFLGRLIALKGVDMLLEAAAPLVRAGRLTVELIGDGPERAPLEAQAQHEQLGAGVTFTGWLPHREVPARLAEADVFVFPSIREFGGGAVLEAMAVGLASIVVDYAGPAELVTPKTGWAIPLGPRPELVARLGARLEALCADPVELDRRGAASLDRAHRQFTWGAKADRVIEVYRWVLGQGPAPDFPMPVPDPT